MSDDEFTRIEPATDPNDGDSEMPDPSGVQKQHVVRSRSPGSNADEDSEFDEDSEVGGRWDSHYSDSLSESEDEAVDRGPIQTMDIAALGRRPRTSPGPALTYHEMIKEAERLEPSITQNELDEFFKGEFKEAFVRRKPLALLRALDLQRVSKLSNLKGVPKIPGSRRINLQALSSDLDAPKDYIVRVYYRAVRYRHRRNNGAPAWMYTIIERFSLCEGRKLKRLLNMPEPSNVDVTRSDRILPFDEMLREAERIEPLITHQELMDFFGGKVSGEFIPRKLLAFERALALHGVSKLSDLEGAPKLPGDRRIDIKSLAINLKLKHNYFVGMRDNWISRYYKNNKPTPDWMCRIMDKFSLNEGRKPLPRIEIVNPIPGTDNRSHAQSPVQALDFQAKSNAGKVKREGEGLYLVMIDESKILRRLIADSEIKAFFGDMDPNKDGIQRNLLAFITVLATHKMSQLKNVPGAPKAPRGNINAAIVSRHLGLKNDYLQWVRGSVRKHERRNKRAPKWMYVLLKRLSLDDGLRGALPWAGEEGGGHIDESAFSQPLIATDSGPRLESSALPGPSGGHQHSSHTHPRPNVSSMDVPEPSNAGTFYKDVAPRYSEVLESARALACSLSDDAILKYFKRFRYADSFNQRKVLAFIRALDQHGASRLDALIGYPAGEDGGVKLKKVADDLHLPDLRYFNKLPTVVKQYEAKEKSIPDWIKDVIDKFSVDRRENRKT